MEENHAKMEETPSQQIGRNEPCPCGSGRKYKRCHGVDAAPKMTAPRMPALGAGAPGAGGMPGMPPGFDPSSLDPEMMGKFMQAMQRLPKGQLQRIQALMQKAMAGKDVSREAAELEKTLPPDFQQMMATFAPMAAGAFGDGGATDPAIAASLDVSAPEAADDMTPEKAREIVMAAVAEGKLSDTEAKELVEETMGTSESGISKLWKNIKGK